MAVMQGYMRSLANYSSSNDEALGFEFYEWVLNNFGIPDEGENINFETYAREFVKLYPNMRKEN